MAPCSALKLLGIFAGLQVLHLGYRPLEDFLLLYLLGQGLITSLSAWVLHSRFFNSQMPLCCQKQFFVSFLMT